MNGETIALWRAVLTRDVAAATRTGGGWFYAALFFAVFAALAGIAIGPELSALSQAASAIIWLAAAFSVQLTVSDIFEGDITDSTLRVLAAEQQSLVPYFAAKAALVFIISVAPIAAASPLILTMFGIAPGAIPALAAVFLIGAPALVMPALFAAALAAGLRAGGLLAVVIAAPFLAPPLIFGVLCVDTYIETAVFWSPETLILGALSLFMTALAPPFSLAALRLGLE
ncbi:MAG: heme exporter protein CcmB [Hyphococcus sp.]